MGGRALILLGIITGLVLARQFGFTAPWFVGSYVLVGITVILGATLIDPFRRRLTLAASSGNAARVRALSEARCLAPGVG